MIRFARWLRPARGGVSPDVATPSPEKCDTGVVESKQEKVSVAVVATFSTHKIQSRANGLSQDSHPEKAATTTTQAFFPEKTKGLDVANSLRRAGDTWRHPGDTRYAHIDFETVNRSECDLTEVGAWRYCEDPQTEILTLAYLYGGKIRSWHPASPFRVPLEWLANDPTVIFTCFGDFELAVWD
jgi:hypothetical protein